MALEIQFVSASWCKACIKIKPDFITHCALLGVTPTWVDYDEIEEGEFKASIKGLPTIMVRTTSVWKHYVASEFDAWKLESASLALTTAIRGADADF